MKCDSCGIEVPSSYMKCPSCGKGFHGINTPSSFDISEQNIPDPNKKVLNVGNVINNPNYQNVNNSSASQLPKNIIIANYSTKFHLKYN